MRRGCHTFAEELTVCALEMPAAVARVNGPIDFFKNLYRIGSDVTNPRPVNADPEHGPMETTSIQLDIKHYSEKDDKDDFTTDIRTRNRRHSDQLVMRRQFTTAH
jgi:hypothetical protein